MHFFHESRTPIDYCVYGSNAPKDRLLHNFKKMSQANLSLDRIDFFSDFFFLSAKELVLLKQFIFKDSPENVFWWPEIWTHFQNFPACDDARNVELKQRQNDAYGP